MQCTVDRNSKYKPATVVVVGHDAGFFSGHGFLFDVIFSFPARSQRPPSSLSIVPWPGVIRDGLPRTVFYVYIYTLVLRLELPGGVTGEKV